MTVVEVVVSIEMFTKLREDERLSRLFKPHLSFFCLHRRFDSKSTHLSKVYHLLTVPLSLKILLVFLSLSTPHGE